MADAASSLGLSKLKTQSGRRALVGLLLFAGALTLYVSVLAPGALGGDPGELQFVPAILGLPHPTGTPLYVLLSKLWSMLPLDSSVAWRLNSLAAVSAGLAVTLVFWGGLVLYDRMVPAMVAALSLALGLTFMEQATLSDKYAFNAMMVALVVALALYWGKTRSARGLYLLAFALGLSLAHHRTALLLTIPVFGYVWWHERARLWRDRQRLLVLAGLILAPLLFYLYLPWAEARDLPPNAWHPQGIKGWIDYLADRGYSGQVYVNPEDVIQRLGFYASTLLRDFTAAGVVLGIAGLLWVLRKRPADGILLAVIFGVQAFLSANYHVPRQWVFFIPSFVIYALWVGGGVMALWSGIEHFLAPQSAGRRAGLLGGTTLIVVILLVLPLPQRYQPLRESHRGAGVLDPWRQTLKTGFMADRLGRAIASVAPDAVIVGDWEQATPLWYFQQVEKLRPDVRIIYPIERLNEAAALGRPLYVARTVDRAAASWHPASTNALVALRSTPSFEVPPEATPLGVRFGEVIELAGYRYGESALRPGQVLPLTLYWKALQSPLRDYAVSLRLFDAAGASIFQVDSEHPVLGMYPTSLWQPSEVISDYYEVQLPPDLAPGTYRWGVILYRTLPEGGWENLQVAGAEGGSAAGGTITVKATR